MKNVVFLLLALPTLLAAQTNSDEVLASFAKVYVEYDILKPDPGLFTEQKTAKAGISASRMMEVFQGNDEFTDKEKKQLSVIESQYQLKCDSILEELCLKNEIQASTYRQLLKKMEVDLVFQNKMYPIIQHYYTTKK